MGVFIANADYNLNVTNTVPGAAIPNGSEGTTPGSFKMNAKAVIVDKITYSPSGCTFPSYTFIGGESAGVLATSVKVKSGGKAVMRLGDVGVCAGVFNLTASPFTPLPCACTLTVDSAGQVKVKGN